MIEKRTFVVPGTNCSVDYYVGEVDGWKVVVFVKASNLTYLDNISYYAGQEYKKWDIKNVTIFGWDKTETESRENMFYRFELEFGTQQTIPDEDTRRFIEHFVDGYKPMISTG